MVTDGRGARGPTVALAGNPNVGKSTIFNGLTNLRQHTGNWSGKTVGCAWGTWRRGDTEYKVVDIPGAYSLRSLTGEEQEARDYICFGGADVTVVVCDASCLERNLDLALQILEVTPNVILAVNLMDQAEAWGIEVDGKALSKQLGAPVVCMSARDRGGLEGLMEAIADFKPVVNRLPPVKYPGEIEREVSSLEPVLHRALRDGVTAQWAALSLLEGQRGLSEAIYSRMDPASRPEAKSAVDGARARLEAQGLSGVGLSDAIVSSIYDRAEEICTGAVRRRGDRRGERQLKVDKFLTRPATGVPVMLAMLALLFFLTIEGANALSGVLQRALGIVDPLLERWLEDMGAPWWLEGALLDGVWRVLSWVVSVMLPPMAIFFPLFTLLEDFGYLPRVAFSLDESFRRAGACGKQALTMCMGLGCNAAGVTGCRIIASPRERLIAAVTNGLVPCNGRFPTLLAMIAIIAAGAGVSGAIWQALGLTLLMGLSVAATLLTSKLLSRTLLKGRASVMTLELPPFRAPKLGQVLTRSFLDRTVFVLGRAAAVAAPAGLIIWCAANVTYQGRTLLAVITGALEGIGRFMGLDGVILTAFILGLPASETVVPIMLMAYTASSTLSPMGSAGQLGEILTAQGWTWETALCTAIFCLMHWPCSTTLLTVKRETGRWRWAALAALLPTVMGMVLCTAVHWGVVFVLNLAV